jgi:hypothetical protein
MPRIGINKNRIKKIIRDQLKDKLKKHAHSHALNKIEQAKKIMLAEFNNHPVTKEIEAGPNASNSSGTLGGVGNLFSFIGFKAGDRPVEPVRKLLENSTQLISVKPKSKGELEFEILIDLPSKEEIAQASPLPWAAARSWVIGIEQGLSGFGQFLVESGKGRSGQAIEVKGSIRSGKFKNKKYISQIISRLQYHLMRSIN